MSLPVPGEGGWVPTEAADTATTGLLNPPDPIGNDTLELYGLEQNNGSTLFSVDAPEEDTEGTPRRRRRPPYRTTRPCCFNVRIRCEGSTSLAFLSHLSFLVASSLYVRMSFLDLAWTRATRNVVPADVLDEDDDAAWSEWAEANDGAVVYDLRDGYDASSRLFYVLASSLFVAVGALDWMRYPRDGAMNVFMILAGAAGVASAVSDTSRGEDVWNCVSVHLFLLEAYNLLNRRDDRNRKRRVGDGSDDDDDDNNDDDGVHSFSRWGDICFLVGSIIDVIVSYVYLAGYRGLHTVYADMTGCFLWLACSLIDLAAEIYYLS